MYKHTPCTCYFSQLNIHCTYVCANIFHTGGLGFSLHNMGTSLVIVGIMMIPMSLLAFNPVSDCVVCGHYTVRMYSQCLYA